MEDSLDNVNYSTSDTLTYLPTRTTRRRIVIATLLFTWSVIGYVVYAGDPSNSLHQSALSWSFTAFMGVIGAYVFGASWENIKLLPLYKKEE